MEAAKNKIAAADAAGFDPSAMTAKETELKKKVLACMNTEEVKRIEAQIKDLKKNRLPHLESQAAREKAQAMKLKGVHCDFQALTTRATEISVKLKEIREREAQVEMEIDGKKHTIEELRNAIEKAKKSKGGQEQQE